MIDPRYEHAQSSNQGGGRGWNFYDPKSPVKAAPKSRKDIRIFDIVLFALIPLSLAALFFAPWAIRTALHMVTQ